MAAAPIPIPGRPGQAELYATPGRQIRELDAIGEIGRLVSASYDLDEIISQSYQLVAGATQAPIFFLGLYDPEAGVFTRSFFVTRGQPPSSLWRNRPPKPASLTSWILQQRRPLLLENVPAQRAELDELGIVPVPCTSGVEVRSWVGVPLLGQESQAIGVLCLQDSRPEAYDRQTVGFLQRVAHLLSLGVQKMQLFMALQQAKETAEAASRTKSAFLATMNHELRTPLNAILGYTELVREELQALGDEQLVRDLGHVSTSGLQLLELIDDILDLARLEADRLEPTREDISIAELVQEVASAVAEQAQRKGIRLNIAGPDAAETINADPRLLRRVLFKLLDNAVKFTERGQITLQVRRSHRAGAEWIDFQLSDTGIGMTGAQLQSIFQPFVQGDSSTTRRYGGIGLGLALSRRFCQLMGGDIEVESELGGGSVFHMHLPAG